VRARTLPKTVAIAGAVLAVLLALFIVPYPYELSGKGTLEPVDRKDIFAQVDGVVEQVNVHHGQAVKRDDPLPLLVLRNDDLAAQVDKVRGELRVALANQASAERSAHDNRLPSEERERFRGQIEQYRAEAESADQQLTLLQNKQEELKVHSPIDGDVITWQVADKLQARPVERGQLLMTVADPKKAWELEVHMPEDRMGAVMAAQNELRKTKPDALLPVTFILATDPGTRHEGEVKEIHKGAGVIGEEGNIVLLRVKIKNDGLDLANIRPGATVTAKVNCGTASLGYVWFHDVIAFVQSKVLFRF